MGPQLRGQQDEASKNRTFEGAESAEAVADTKEVQATVQKATEVLQAYYAAPLRTGRSSRRRAICAFPLQSNFWWSDSLCYIKFCWRRGSHHYFGFMSLTIAFQR